MKPFVRPLAFALALALPGGLVGACAAPPAATMAAADRASIRVTASLRAPAARALQQLKPGGGRIVQPLDASDVDHVVVRLYSVEGATETLVAAMDVPASALEAPATFNRLRANATYRLKARAFKAPGEDAADLISKDAASSVDVTTGLDDRTTWAAVPVQLADLWMDASASTPFTGPAIDILPGGVTDGLRGLYLPFAGLLGANNSADGQGPAAEFRGPVGLAAGAGGDVFVAQQATPAIRRITSQGVVTTLVLNTEVAGEGLRAPFGVAAIGNSYLYVADKGSHTIREVQVSTGDMYIVAGTLDAPGDADGDVDGDVEAVPPLDPATTLLQDPEGVTTLGEGQLALDGLMIADTGNGKLKHLDTSTYELTTIVSGLASPVGMVVADGYLYVAERGKNRIVRVDLSTEGYQPGNAVVEHVAGDAATFAADFADDVDGDDARFAGPCALAWASPYLYVLDAGNHRIRRILPDGETNHVDTVLDLDDAGLTGGFGAYGGLAWMGDSLLVADNGNDVVRRVR